MPIWRSSKIGARTSSGQAKAWLRTGEGVRCRGPSQHRGGVGDVWKPGGLEGDRRGSTRDAGAQSSSKAWLGAWLARGEVEGTTRLDIRHGGRTVVGDNGGDIGGVRSS